MAVTAILVTSHWNGKRWSVQPSPATVASPVTQLNGVTACRAGIWAVGEYRSKGHTTPLIEHWNGFSWKVVPSPN